MRFEEIQTRFPKVKEAIGLVLQDNGQSWDKLDVHRILRNITISQLMGANEYLKALTNTEFDSFCFEGVSTDEVEGSEDADAIVAEIFDNMISYINKQ